jgi:hypothetical protein
VRWVIGGYGLQFLQAEGEHANEWSPGVTWLVPLTPAAAEVSATCYASKLLQPAMLSDAARYAAFPGDREQGPPQYRSPTVRSPTEYDSSTGEWGWH